MTIRECIKWHEDYVRWAKKNRLMDTVDAQAAVIALNALNHYMTSRARVEKESIAVSGVT